MSTPTIHYTETLPDGSKLEVRGGCFKPLITRKDGTRIGYVKSLKRTYKEKKIIFRPDHECIALAIKWAYTHYDKQ